MIRIMINWRLSTKLKIQGVSKIVTQIFVKIRGSGEGGGLLFLDKISRVCTILCVVAFLENKVFKNLPGRLYHNPVCASMDFLISPGWPVERLRLTWSRSSWCRWWCRSGGTSSGSGSPRGTPPRCSCRLPSP